MNTKRVTITVLTCVLLVSFLVPRVLGQTAIDEHVYQHTIHYQMLEAGEVTLVWGINGWQQTSLRLPLSNTIVKEEVMHTLMSNEGDYFSASVIVPAGATLDYGFLITSMKDGSQIEPIWDGGFESILVEQDATTWIDSHRALPSSPLVEFVGDFKTRLDGVLLLFGGLFLIGLMIASPKLFPARFHHAEQLIVDRPVVRITSYIVGVKALLLVIGYLAVVTFPQSGSENVLIEPLSSSQFGEAFTRGDITWYFEIAQDGYEERPFSASQKANWAFYPLWPLVLRVSKLLGMSMAVWGTAVANLLSLVAGISLYKLMRLDFNERTSELATILCFAFPGAYFMMRPGPESLFFLLVILTLYASRKQLWVLSGFLGALAVLTRLQGLLLLFPLIYMWLMDYRKTRKFQIEIIAFALIPIALLLHMANLYTLTGEFMASFHIQHAWDHHQSYPFAASVRFLSFPSLVNYYGWNLRPVNFLAAMGAVAVGIYSVLYRRMSWAYLIYMALSLYIIVARDNLNASLRYMIPIFPIYITLAHILYKRETMKNWVLLLFGAIQTLFFIAFALQINWAVT